MIKVPYLTIKRKRLEALEKELAVFKKEVEKATSFIESIDSAEVHTQQELEQNSELLNALLEMREKFKANAIKDAEAKWANEGLASFVDILRSDSDSRELFYKVISHLVKYLEGNQGALYIVEEENDETTISLVSSYAWNRKKHLKYTVKPGEGLVGQCYLEKDIIFLTEVPDNYVNITSGLGDSNPTCLVLIPMIYNEKMMGVIEIASFKEILPYQMDFLSKVGENIAASVSAVKTNEAMKRLLSDATEQAEQMRAQEEEMRQNMEELQSTQEEMHRKQKVLSESEARNKLFFDSAFYGIIGVDENGHIVDINDAGATILGKTVNELSNMPIDNFIKGLPFKSYGRAAGKKKRVMANGQKVELLINQAQTDQGNVYVAYLNGDIQKEIKKEAELAKTLMAMDEQQDHIRQQKEEVIKQKQISDAFLNHSLDAILLMDQEGIIVEKNQRAIDFLKMQSSESSNINDIINNFNLNNSDRFLGKTRRVMVTDGEGKKFKVEFYISKIQVEDREYFISYIRDITDQLKKDAELAKALMQLDNLRIQLDEKQVISN